MSLTEIAHPVEIDHPAFMIMPGINPMAVDSVAQSHFHDSSRQYSYLIQPAGSLGVSPPVCVSATIGQVNNEPAYIERKMMLRTNPKEYGLFGSVIIKHNRIQTETGFTPDDGQVHYFDYKTQMDYFLHDGSLVTQNRAGVRQLVGDNAQFYDGKRRMSVDIDTSGIAVRISGQDFANISFYQSGVSIAVGNFRKAPYTYAEELYFSEK